MQVCLFAVPLLKIPAPLPPPIGQVAVPPGQNLIWSEAITPDPRNAGSVLEMVSSSTLPSLERNWDLVALFLFGPGLLLILQAKDQADAAADRVRLIGYLWLLGASAYWFGRCLFDLATVKRPLVTPNLSTAGLAWFGGSLFLCFTAVAFTRADPWGPVGKRPAALAGVQEGAAAVVRQAAPKDAVAEEVASRPWSAHRWRWRVTSWWWRGWC